MPSASATPPGTSSTANAAAAPPLTLDHAAAVPPSTPPEGIVHIKNRSYFLSSAKWPRGSSGSFAIPVCWESGVPDSQERGWVRDAVTQSWQLHSKIVFIGWVNCADSAVGVRITVKDDGANDGPHTQDLGRLLNGRPNGMVLNFTFSTWSPTCKAADMRESCIRSIAVHEFGHAIGFAHEQNRPDTPGECTEKPQGRSGDLMLTPWDAASVMNYCNPVYNNNGILSQNDVDGLHEVYDAP